MIEDRLVQVRLREGRKPKRYALPDEFDVSVGDWVVVPLDEDEDCGVVAAKPMAVTPEWEDAELPSVLEIPSDDEIKRAKKGRKEKETDAIARAYEEVREYELDLKLVTVYYFHRGNKMKFYFTAENRVDFRDLVKDLAHLFQARIEMRQVGIRDAAGMIGGYGLCGQEMCCSRFLKGFDPITIRMAKDQNLALNPTKISGCCGRLLCCLKYEHENYIESNRHYPRPGTAASVDNRTLKVVGYNIIKETVSVLSEAQIVEISLEDFKQENPGWRNAGRFSKVRAETPPEITASKDKPSPPDVADNEPKGTDPTPQITASANKEEQAERQPGSGKGPRRRRRRGRKGGTS